MSRYFPFLNLRWGVWGAPVDFWGAAALIGGMSHYDHEPPPRVPPTVIAAPRIRQVYWCRLPTDAELPELWKIRPGIIVSYKNTLHGAVTIIPTTTVEQPGNQWAYRLAMSLDPSKVSWAICDKPMTVAVSRLQPRRIIPRLTEEDFREVMLRLLEWLPKLPPP